MDVEGTIGSNRVRFSHIGYQSGSTYGTMTANFGQKSFAYTPPTGYKKLNQDNLPETAKGVSGLVWVKNRDQGSNSHALSDSSRGASKVLFSNTTDGEQTYVQGLTKFLKGGFACGDLQYINGSGDSLVSWNWVANGGTTASNTDGSITSTVQVNQTAGFSVVQFTPGSAGTVGHGLSQAPEWILMKDTSRSVLWLIYHKDIGADKYLQFTTAAVASNSTVFSTEPTSSVFDPGTGYTSASSYGATVAYCWHGVDGFSKFGSYKGNGSTDGPFVYTGFKPAWFLVKRSDTANDWELFDSVRNPFNPVDRRLYPNLTSVEAVGSTSDIFDFTANGCKVREDNPAINASGGTYIYMAFAEHPFVGDGTNPVTAR